MMCYTGIEFVEKSALPNDTDKKRPRQLTKGNCRGIFYVAEYKKKYLSGGIVWRSDSKTIQLCTML